MTESPKCTSSPLRQPAGGADAAAAPSPSTLRPLFLRVFIGAIAIGGLSAIGAFSMLAGIEGAHASPPPAASNAWLAASAEPSSHHAHAPPNAREPAPQDSAASAATQPAQLQEPCPRVTTEGKVILNRAGVDELRKIPGIGPKRALAILELRKKLKRFRKPEELLRVKGIGAKSLIRIKPAIVLDDPSGSQCEEKSQP